MDRRTFNKLLSTGIIGSTLPIEYDIFDLKKSSVLKKGDKIGLITPASPIEEKHFTMAKANLDKLGLPYFHTDNIFLKKGFLAGSDQVRLAEIHQMYADPSIKGIWCIRGGYGVTRILDRLDFKLIKKNRKPLIGYSDITALLNTIHQKTKSPCFHGPCIGFEITDYQKQNLAPLFGLNQSFTISLSENNIAKGKEESVYQYSTIVPGKVSGKLVGGNLSLLVSLIGTDHAVKTKNKLVFLEDVGESPYRIDRMLTQLISAGYFDKARGIILGVFAGCERKNKDKQSLLEVIKDRLAPLNKPTMYGFSFGHIDDQCTFPIGAKAEMDTEERTVRIL